MVKYLFEHGPATLGTIDSELLTKQGMKWLAKPTTRQARRVLKLDRRIIQEDYIYNVDLQVLKEINWERW